MADWSFVLADTAGTAITELTAATGRQLTWRLEDQCDASFAVDARHPHADDIVELACDLVAYRNGQRMFRGRIGSTDDNLGPDTHVASFGAVDYRGLLDRRFVLSPLSWTTTDLADIGWELIVATQTRTYGDLGIHRGPHGAAGIGTLKTHTAALRAKISDSIDLVADTWGGFEWEIDPQLAFQVYSLRGNPESEWAATYTADGGNVISGRRTVDTAEYANVVIQTGADGLAAEIRAAPDLTERPEGRIEFLDGNTDLTTQPMVAAAADVLLAVHGNLVPAYQFTLAQDVWSGPGDVWVGDSTVIHVDSGRLNVTIRERVVEVQIDIDDDGAETVALTYGTQRADLIRLLRLLPRRLERLERR